jgi:hypothetical protein
MEVTFTPGERATGICLIGSWLGLGVGVVAVARRKRESLYPSEIEPRLCNPKPNHCTDWATPAHLYSKVVSINRLHIIIIIVIVIIIIIILSIHPTVLEVKYYDI